MALRTGSPRRQDIGESIRHEGMDEWTREMDNRLRELTAKKERGDELTEEEQKERATLEVTNKKFLDAGVAFQRGEKLNSLETIVVLMGYSVGIGNLWRFSHLTAKHGGLAFVIAYLLCLVFLAQPLYLLELSLGQDARAGIVHCHRQVARRWAGVGYGFVTATIIVQGYYSMFLAYTLIYLGNSLITPLPWSEDAHRSGNVSLLPPDKSPAEYFWNHDILGDDGEASGMWKLVIALMISYVLIFFAVWRGIATASKIAYATVSIPCVLLFALTIWTLTLSGAGEGLKYFVGRLEWSSLYKIDMWADAASQTMFSLIFLPGTTITLASYMQEKEDVYRIHSIVTWANAAFSIIGAFAIFAVMGHTSHKSCDWSAAENMNMTLVNGSLPMISGCRTVEQIVRSNGAGLAFVALAEGIATIPGPNNLFAVFFFLMCFLLGLDTCFAGVEVLCIFVRDNFTYFGKTARQDYTALALTFTFFLFGILYCGPWGFKLLESVDHHLTTYIMLFGQMLQCIMFQLDWTWDRLECKIQLSTIGNPGFPRGRVVPKRYRFLLYWFIPICCFVLAIGFFIEDIVEPFGSRNGRSYSSGYIVVGYFITICVFAIMPMANYIENWYSGHLKSKKESKEAIAEPLLGDARELCEVEETENPQRELTMSMHQGGQGGQGGESLLSLDEISRNVAASAQGDQTGGTGSSHSSPRSKKKQPNRVRRSSNPLDDSRGGEEGSPGDRGSRSGIPVKLDRPRRRRDVEEAELEEDEERVPDGPILEQAKEEARSKKDAKEEEAVEEVEPVDAAAEALPPSAAEPQLEGAPEMEKFESKEDQQAGGKDEGPAV